MPGSGDVYTEEDQIHSEIADLTQFIDYLDACLGRRIFDYRGLRVSQHIIDAMTEAICRTIRAMTEGQKDATIYNGRSKIGRQLADWWEERQVSDVIKASSELAVSQMTPEERSGLTRQVMWKITPEEWAAVIYAVKNGEID